MFAQKQFWLDGKSSDEFGIYNVRLQPGGAETPLWGNRTLIKDSIPNRDQSFLFGVNNEPIKFTMVFSLLEEAFTYANKLAIMEWLLMDNKYYREMIFEDEEHNFVHYYVMVVGESVLNSFANNLGHFQVQIETNAPWGFSPAITTPAFDLTENFGTTTIVLENKSNVQKFYQPEIWIKLYGTETSFSLLNTTNGGQEMYCTGLNQGELLHIKNDKKQIISSTGLKRFSNFAQPIGWLTLVKGNNNIEVTGQCELTVRYQYKIVV